MVKFERRVVFALGIVELAQPQVSFGASRFACHRVFERLFRFHGGAVQDEGLGDHDLRFVKRGENPERQLRFGESLGGTLARHVGRGSASVTQRFASGDRAHVGAR